MNRIFARLVYESTELRPLYFLKAQSNICFIKNSYEITTNFYETDVILK